jgi:riboflavin-specific deaminase-like protein
MISNALLIGIRPNNTYTFGNHHRHRHRHRRTSDILRSSSSSNNEGHEETEELKYAQSKLNNIKGVTLKMAFDTAYAVADASEQKSERFTSPESLDMVHKLRRWSDAVLVGRGTVERDNCTLTVRRCPLLPNKETQPVRVVIDPNLKILSSEKGEYSMLNDGHPVLIYHDDSIDTEKYKPLISSNDNVDIVKLPPQSDLSSSLSSSPNLSVESIVEDLYSKNIHHIMVEGGPATAIQFLDGKLVDRAIIVRAPVTFIEPVPSGISNDMLIEAGLILIKVESSGDDMIEYWSRGGASWPSIDDNEEEEVKATTTTWPY